jgi:cell wall-associated NlpC family hydrolase
MRLILLIAALVASTLSHAGPSSASDDMAQFMAERGLVSRLGAVGSKVEARASELVLNAMAFLGVPYKLGGDTAATGFDCSGFVRAIYEQTAGLMLPRRAEQQAAATQSISKADLQPGDLVFFNTLRKAFSHVGIYVGDGKFIHSPRPGAEVRVEDMDVRYWSKRFDGARRVSADETQTAAIH